MEEIDPVRWITTLAQRGYALWYRTVRKLAEIIWNRSVHVRLVNYDDTGSQIVKYRKKMDYRCNVDSIPHEVVRGRFCLIFATSSLSSRWKCGDDCAWRCKPPWLRSVQFSQVILHTHVFSATVEVNVTACADVIGIERRTSSMNWIEIIVIDVILLILFLIL